MVGFMCKTYAVTAGMAVLVNSTATAMLFGMDWRWGPLHLLTARSRRKCTTATTGGATVLQPRHPCDEGSRTVHAQALVQVLRLRPKSLRQHGLCIDGVHYVCNKS